MAAKNPEPRARKAAGSIFPVLGDITKIIPMKDVIDNINTGLEAFSLIIVPDSNATNNGEVYCKVTACPISIFYKAEKYKIIANNPTKHLKNIVLVSLGFKFIE